MVMLFFSSSVSFICFFFLSFSLIFHIRIIISLTFISLLSIYGRVVIVFFSSCLISFDFPCFYLYLTFIYIFFLLSLHFLICLSVKEVVIIFFFFRRLLLRFPFSYLSCFALLSFCHFIIFSSVY